jgi:high-affinity iron transporter
VGIDLGLLGEFAYRLPISADSIFHHKGLVGSVFAVMFGYAVSAEWVRVVVHLGYLAIVLPTVLRIYWRR